MRYIFILLSVILLLSFSEPALAEGHEINEKETQNNIDYETREIINRIKEENINFDPEKVAVHLERKGMELIGLAQSGSVLYISFALVAFLALLFVGIFFKTIRKIAFSILFFACLGFVLINYWSEIIAIGKSIVEWLTSIGGDENANSSSI